MKPYAKPAESVQQQRQAFRRPTARQLERERRQRIHNRGIAQVRRQLESVDVP